jgi:hypothetical protein
MSAQLIEAFLARIYVDEASRRRFLADPTGEALRFGLSPAEARQLAAIDCEGLEMAAESYERKREKRCERHRAETLRPRDGSA